MLNSCDLDTIKNNSIYTLFDSQTYTNSPHKELNLSKESINTGILITLSYNKNKTIIYQYFIPYASTSTPVFLSSSMFYRIYASSNWSSWRKMLNSNCLYPLGGISATTASNNYSNLASNLPINTYSWVSANWFNDINNDFGTGWIITLAASMTSVSEPLQVHIGANADYNNINVSYGTQLFISVTNRRIYFRYYNNSTSEFYDWFDFSAKSSDIIVTKNLLDLSITEYASDGTGLENGYYNSSNGSYVSSETVVTGPYVELDLTEYQYIIQPMALQINFYTENKTHINVTGTATKNTPIKIPNNAKYVRFCYSKSAVGKNYRRGATNTLVAFYTGTKIPDTYIPFGEENVYYNDILIKDDNVKLNTYSTSLASLGKTDLNTVTNVGIYFGSQPATYTNCPIAGKAFNLVVLNGSGDVIIQRLILLNNAKQYSRLKIGTNDWGAWGSNDVSEEESIHDTQSVYYAFGDSTTKGQIGGGSGGTSEYNYPNCAGKVLHMNVINKGVGGQGLLKDWDFIHSEYINGLDMSDAKLITIGWAYNDTYTNINFGNYTDVTDTTFIGKYYTILKEFQEKCPNAQIILITGYGAPGGKVNPLIKATCLNQFTQNYGFLDGSHTVKEMYDTLEQMANLHGWPCINQSKGCAINKFNCSELIGDQIHPTNEGYLRYGNYLAARIASFYSNI